MSRFADVIAVVMGGALVIFTLTASLLFIGMMAGWWLR